MNLTSPLAPLVFLSPVRVYEYLIQQTGHTCAVNANKASRYSRSGLNKEYNCTQKSAKSNYQINLIITYKLIIIFLYFL